MIWPTLFIFEYTLGIRDQSCARRRLLTSSIYIERVLGWPSDYVLGLIVGKCVFSRLLRRTVFPNDFILLIRGGCAASFSGGMFCMYSGAGF
jgi:hypothetical protein